MLFKLRKHQDVARVRHTRIELRPSQDWRTKSRLCSFASLEHILALPFIQIIRKPQRLTSSWSCGIFGLENGTCCYGTRGVNSEGVVFLLFALNPSLHTQNQTARDKTIEECNESRAEGGMHSK